MHNTEKVVFFCLHVVYPLFFAVVRHVRDYVDGRYVSRDDADALPPLPNGLAHLLPLARCGGLSRSGEVAKDTSDGANATQTQPM